MLDVANDMVVSKLRSGDKLQSNNNIIVIITVNYNTIF